MSNSTPNIHDESAAVDARALLELIPCAVLVRHASGRVLYANAAARECLAIDAATNFDALTLTHLVGDETPSTDPNAVHVFLLMHDQAVKTRFAARRRDYGEDREALVLVDAAKPRKAAPAHGSRRRQFTARSLTADVVRRIRKHAGPATAQPVRAQHRLTRGRDGARLIDADPVGIAQLVLSGLLLLAESDSPCTGIQVAVAGLQFRIVVEGQSTTADGIFPDLQRQTALLRSIRPILSEHDATFALERDKRGTRRIVITLPFAG